MCINVIKGDYNLSHPVYTAGGSFWMTTRPNSGHVKRMQTRKIPETFAIRKGMSPWPDFHRWGDQILGLIHIADRRENMVPLEWLEMLEKGGVTIRDGLGAVECEEALREK